MKEEKQTLETLAREYRFQGKADQDDRYPLEPMNPYERRIIHAAVQNDKYVVTRSEGDEPYRHVIVSLKKETSRRAVTTTTAMTAPQDLTERRREDASKRTVITRLEKGLHKMCKPLFWRKLCRNRRQIQSRPLQQP